MAALTLKDVVRCPVCDGSDVVYTCEPKCCFNHVCSDCRASFELATHKAAALSPFPPPHDCSLPDSTEPTVACAACESLRLAVTSVPQQTPVLLVCADCGASLELSYEGITSG